MESVTGMAIVPQTHTLSPERNVVGVAWILAAIAIIREQDLMLANAHEIHPFDEWDNESVSSGGGELALASDEGEMTGGAINVDGRCVTCSKSRKYLGLLSPVVGCHNVRMTRVKQPSREEKQTRILSTLRPAQTTG